MENEVQIFEHEQFGKIRVVIINEKVWFVAADVCRALELTNPTVAVSRLDADEKFKFHLGQIYGEINCVNEPGFYHLVCSSRKPEALKFQHWVYHEVLPQILRIGIYSTENFLNQLFKSASAAKNFKILKCVYAFEMENGTVKIGYTQNVRKRMQTIMTSSGLDIVNAYCTEFFDSEIAYCIEQACHETFDAWRVRGEFFKISFADACAELEKYSKIISAENQKNCLQQVTL